MEKLPLFENYQNDDYFDITPEELIPPVERVSFDGTLYSLYNPSVSSEELAINIIDDELHVDVVTQDFTTNNGEWFVVMYDTTQPVALYVGTTEHLYVAD